LTLPAVAAWLWASWMQDQLEEPTFRNGNKERQFRSCREGDEDRDLRVDQDDF